MIPVQVPRPLYGFVDVPRGRTPPLEFQPTAGHVGFLFFDALVFNRSLAARGPRARRTLATSERRG